MTSVLGFAPWSPNRASRKLVESVQEILDDNEEFLPLTGRQIFYMLVGQYRYDKTELAYHRLLDKLNRARRSRLIPFHAIRDDGVTMRGGGWWSGEDQFLGSIIPSAKAFKMDRQRSQTSVIEIWVEAAGMVPQIARVATNFSIITYSSGGFNSTTMKHSAAARFCRRFQKTNQLTTVLHIGDHDPSGVAIFENLSLDIPSFCAGMGCPGISWWKRIAVTPEQIEKHELEESPPKKTDSRSVNWEGGTVQVEAMRPEVIADEVQSVIVEQIDFTAYDEAIAEEIAVRDRLINKLESIMSE